MTPPPRQQTPRTLHARALLRAAIQLAGRSALTSTALTARSAASPRRARDIVAQMLVERLIRPVGQTDTGRAGRPATVYELTE